MNRGKLLLVDDDQLLLQSMAQWLRQRGYSVTEANSATMARAELRAREFDLALVDVRLEDGAGFDVVAEFRHQSARTPFVLMTGYGSVETGIEALRAGASDLLLKPLLDSELESAIERVLKSHRPEPASASTRATPAMPDASALSESTRQLARQLDLRLGMEQLVGSDPRIEQIFGIVQRVADTRATILITGENGTGKSLLARSIHYRSSRRERSFVEVACGALPENLMESELFGHVPGAFTGATGARRGKFAQADGGTIFLDEIGTASPSLQVKLLRVLQDFEFEPVGGSETLHVDARVILATNENLRQRVTEGTFRQDLYYRINVINIEIPPLRERVGDIPKLAEHFLQQAICDLGGGPRTLTPEAIQLLQHHRWPGNVRELQNVVERAVLLGRGVRITPDDFPPHLRAENQEFAPETIHGGEREGCERGGGERGNLLKDALSHPERQIILDELEANNWNRSLTAERLGINRTTLYKKMKRLGLNHRRQLAGH